MDISLEDLPEAWCLDHAPAVAEDPDQFTALLQLIHALLTPVVREERRANTQRLLKVSSP